MGFQGIQTSIAKKLYMFVIFQGVESGPMPPSGSAHDEIKLGTIDLADVF